MAEQPDEVEVDLTAVDILHLRVDDECVISVNGQGHLPCHSHDYREAANEG